MKNENVRGRWAPLRVSFASLGFVYFDTGALCRDSFCTEYLEAAGMKPLNPFDYKSRGATVWFRIAPTSRVRLPRALRVMISSPGPEAGGRWTAVPSLRKRWDADAGVCFSPQLAKTLGLTDSGVHYLQVRLKRPAGVAA